jgi:hypothetical protein
LNTNNYPHPNYIDFPSYTHEYTIRLFKPIMRSSISSRSIETLYMQSIFIILRFHSFSLYFDCYSLCLIYFNWIFLCSIFSRSLYIIFVLFPSSIYVFWLHLWYLQSLLVQDKPFSLVYNSLHLVNNLEQVLIFLGLVPFVLKQPLVILCYNVYFYWSACAKLGNICVLQVLILGLTAIFQFIFKFPTV